MSHNKEAVELKGLLHTWRKPPWGTFELSGFISLKAVRDALLERDPASDGNDDIIRCGHTVNPGHLEWIGKHGRRVMSLDSGPCAKGFSQPPFDIAGLQVIHADGGPAKHAP